MSALEELEGKIGLLLQRHRALLAENKKLRKALAEKEDQLTAVQAQLAAAAQEAAGDAIAAALPDRKDRAAARRQIDAVIKEIDKILMNLND